MRVGAIGSGSGAVAGMSMKRFTTTLITRFGYRQVLVGNTLLVGVTMASFALAAPSQPLWVHVVQLAVFGAVNSLQFTAMNTVTLKDLGHDMASSGNSLLKSSFRSGWVVSSPP